MNVRGETDGQEIQCELKYCERCGGLWLRLLGVKGVYCRGCHMILAAMPDPGEAPVRKTRGRRKARVPGMGAKGGMSRSSGQIDNLQGVAAMEVWA